MKPMQLFVREVAAPTLRSAGYKGSGGTFRYLHPDGHLAVIQLRAWRVMQRELEFHVDLGLVVQAKREFIAETMDLVGEPLLQPGPLAKADASASALSDRLPHGRGGINNYWQFDRDDDEMVELFRTRLGSAATWLRSVTEPRVLESLLRDGDELARRWADFPPAVLRAILLVDQRRFDELPAVLEKTEGAFLHDRLIAWVERRVAASAGS